MQESEVWLPVVGFEGLYSISNQGRIRGERRGKILKAHIKPNGYPSINLSPRAGRRETFLLHVLVLTAFVGPRPPGMVCAHGDGSKANNRPENLRWATIAENAADRKLHGTNQEGESSGSAKLKVAQVLAIRSDPRTHRAIAAEYGICKASVNYIKHRVNWASIK